MGGREGGGGRGREGEGDTYHMGNPLRRVAGIGEGRGREGRGRDRTGQGVT